MMSWRMSSFILPRNIDHLFITFQLVVDSVLTDGLEIFGIVMLYCEAKHPNVTVQSNAQACLFRSLAD